MGQDGVAKTGGGPQLTPTNILTLLDDLVLAAAQVDSSACRYAHHFRVFRVFPRLLRFKRSETKAGGCLDRASLQAGRV